MPPMSDGEVFLHVEVDCRVVFGAGARWRIAEEVERLPVAKVVVISGQRSKGVAHVLAEACGERSAGVLPDAVMHVPTDLAERTAEAVRALGADGIVAVGGGSAIGLAKAVARRRDVAILAVPTSYSGSEMTPIWGETQHGAKTTGRSSSVKPRTVIYDVDLTLSLPKAFTITSGVNAVAHAVEGLYAAGVSPLRSVVAEEAIRRAVSALPSAAADLRNREARTELLQAAWMCGSILGSVSMGLHHKLCHILGGRLDLPHAETHTVVLPHVMAFNLVPGGEARGRVARAVGDPNPAQCLWRRIAAMGGPTSLRDLGMARADVAGVVDQVLSDGVANPRAIEAEALTELLSRALAGAEPVETWA